MQFSLLVTGKATYFCGLEDTSNVSIAQLYCVCGRKKKKKNYLNGGRAPLPASCSRYLVWRAIRIVCIRSIIFLANRENSPFASLRTSRMEVRCCIFCARLSWKPGAARLFNPHLHLKHFRKKFGVHRQHNLVRPDVFSTNADYDVTKRNFWSSVSETNAKSHVIILQNIVVTCVSSDINIFTIRITDISMYFS